MRARAPITRPQAKPVRRALRLGLAPPISRSRWLPALAVHARAALTHAATSPARYYVGPQVWYDATWSSMLQHGVVCCNMVGLALDRLWFRLGRLRCLRFALRCHWEIPRLPFGIGSHTVQRDTAPVTRAASDCLGSDLPVRARDAVRGEHCIAQRDTVPLSPAPHGSRIRWGCRHSAGASLLRIEIAVAPSSRRLRGREHVCATRVDHSAQRFPIATAVCAAGLS